VPAGSIIVVPIAGPDYDVPARTAGPSGCVITAAGGVGAHLAVVGRELGLRVVRVEDAVTLYPPDTLVEIDLDTGKVQVSTHTVRDLFGGNDGS
jgi:phosphohistidine swiveling domain-containing protein